MSQGFGPDGQPEMGHPMQMSIPPMHNMPVMQNMAYMQPQQAVGKARELHGIEAAALLDLEQLGIQVAGDARQPLGHGGGIGGDVAPAHRGRGGQVGLEQQRRQQRAVTALSLAGVPVLHHMAY